MYDKLISGEPQVLEPANPGAQVPYTWTLTEVIEVKSVKCQLVTDANAANRYVNISFRYGAGSYIIRAYCSVSQAAGTTREYDPYQGEPAATAISAGPGASVVYQWPFPKMIIGPGFFFMIGCANMQVGDQLQNIKIHYLRWRVV